MAEKNTNGENRDWLHMVPGGEGRLVVQFSYNREWYQWMRKVPGAKWKPAIKGWEFPAVSESVKVFCRLFEGVPIHIPDRSITQTLPSC